MSQCPAAIAKALVGKYRVLVRSGEVRDVFLMTSLNTAFGAILSEALQTCLMVKIATMPSKNTRFYQP